MSDVISGPKTPSFVIYIISTHITLMVIAALPMLFDSLTASTVLANQLVSNSSILLGDVVLSGIEILLLRRGFGLFPFSASLLIEFGKLWTTAQLLTNVGDQQLLLALSAASAFSLFVSKLFTQKIKNFAQSPLSNNITQVLPAVAIIALFAGSSIATTLGIGPVSQVPNPQFFNTSNINFNQFNIPSWNAQYYLDNILDSLGTGSPNPFLNVLNVTNNNHDANTPNQKLTPYLKQATYFNYLYDPVKAKSGTFFPATTGTTNQILYDSGTTYYYQSVSRPIPSNYFYDMNKVLSSRSYSEHSVTVSMDINHTSTFSGTIPAVRSAGTYGYNSYGNNFFGSYIDPSSVQVYSTDGNQLLNDCGTNYQISSCSFTEDDIQIANFNGVSDVGLQLNGFPQSADSVMLKYSQNYIDPSYDQLNAFSMNESSYQQVFSPATWNAIKSLYLQIPTGPNNESYLQWSPASYAVAAKYYNSSASVMENINALQNAMTPGVDFNENGNRIYVPSGSLGLKFNVKLWLTPQIYTLTNTTIPHPDPNTNQEYVQWLLTNSSSGDGAVFAQFAAGMTMILREMGIPARFVTGYAYGNTSSTATSDPQTTVYQALHQIAWTEALVPLLTPSGLSYEWVTVDPVGSVIQPILNAIASTVGSSQKYDFLDPYSYNPSLVLKSPAGKTNFGESIFRVGVDQKNTTTGLFDNKYDPQGSDTGILYANGPYSVDPIHGVVHVAVFVAKLNFYYTTLEYVTGAGSVPVTFKLVHMSSLNSYTIRNWNSTTSSVTVYSDPITSIAQVTFSYQEFNSSGIVNGIGAVNFLANTTDPNSQIIVNNLGNPLIPSRTAISDTNRTIVSSGLYNSLDPQDVFAYDNFTPFSYFNSYTLQGYPVFTYSPITLSTSPAPPLLEQAKTIQTLNIQKTNGLSNLIVTNVQKTTLTSIRKNSSQVGQSYFNNAFIILFGFILGLPVIRKSNKKLKLV